MANLPANMGEALWIGHGAGSNFFNVGIGQGTTNGANQHTDYDQSAIVSGAAEAAESTKFFLNASGNPVFHINASAGTTSTNTVHPRSELRELLADGVTKAAWDGRTGKHYMWGRSRMTAFTDRRPWICFFQIHGSNNSPNTSDLIRIQTEGTNGTTTNLSIVSRHSPPSTPDSETRTVLRTGYDQDDWVSWQIQVGGDTSSDNGRIQVWLDGVRVLNITGMGQIACYFKTGCYLQDSVAEGAGSGTGGTVEMEKGSLVVWHTGYPTPTTPVFTGGTDPGGGTDTTPPTVPDNLFGIRDNGKVTLGWDESFDVVGVTGYKVYRSSVEDTGSTTAQLGQTANSGASSTSSANKTVVSKFTAATTGKVTAGHARLWIDTGSANTQMVIYADSAGAPGALLAQSNVVAVANTTEAQKDYTFSGGNQLDVVSGTAYWIGFTWVDPGTPTISWSRASTASSASQNSSFLANPFGAATTLSGPIDAFVDVVTTTTGDVLVATVTGTSYVDTGRTNGVAYTYHVSAIDAAANESAKSDPVVVTPGAPDLTAPTVPTGLTGVSGDRKATLSWNPSTDTDTGVRDYRIYLGGTLVATVDAPTTTYTATDLVNGSTYVYTVSARDNSLNESAQSSSVNVVPTAPPIAGVPFLTRELGSAAKIGLEIAFGANLTADPNTWTWTDVTTDVRTDPGFATSLGRSDESGHSNPASFTVQLRNENGDYSLGGRSRFWPYVRRGTPVRLRLDPADGGGGRVVFWGSADGWTPGWDSLTGKIPTVALSASGTLRRLSQGQSPVKSAYRRATEVAANIVSYWPLEEGKDTTTVQALVGGSNLQIEGKPDWASNEDFFCSAPLLTMKTSRLAVFPAPYPVTGQTQVRTLVSIAEGSTIPTGSILLSVVMTGSIVRWDLSYTLFSNGPGLTLRAYRKGDAKLLSETLISVNGTLGSPLLLGTPGRFSLELTERSGSVDFRFNFINATPDENGIVVENFATGTVPGQTAGAVSWIMYGATQNNGDVAFGHLTLQNGITDRTESINALLSFTGELAVQEPPRLSRMYRLGQENGVNVFFYTDPTFPSSYFSDFDRMGPQTVATLLDLLHEAEDADGGQLWDGRSPGLAYTMRRRREWGAVRMTIDAAKGELASSFAPVDDDQRTRNKVEVKRTFGTAYTYQDVSGPMGSNTIGIYDESVTINTRFDSSVIDHAQFRVSAGTIEGHRFPQITLDLRKTPRLAASVLDAVPGERIDVINLDDTLEEFTAQSVSLVIEGISHKIGPKEWKVTFNCSPFEAVGIGAVAKETGDTSDMVMRLDTDGSRTTSQKEKGATSLDVVSTGAAWTTLADDYPFYISVGGLPIKVFSCSSAANSGTLPSIRARTSGTFDTQVTDHPITLPQYSVGDLLVVIFSHDDAGATPNDASGLWSKSAARTTTGHGAAVFTRRATGQDNLTISTTAPTSTDPVNILQEIAFEITSTAENSTKDWTAQYSYIEDIGDNRGYTGGIFGATSATGDMLDIVKNWTNINPSNILAKYIAGLEDCFAVGISAGASAAATANLGASFLADWATAASDPVWQKVQRDYRDTVYWAPAYAAAIADGVGPLGVCIYYDTSINHGPGVPNSSDGSFDDIRSRTTGTKPSAGGSINTWLNNFLNLRETVLTAWGDAPVDGRVPMFRQMIIDGQNNLAYPISWSVYGDPFTITTAPTPVGGGTVSNAAQEGTYQAFSVKDAASVVVQAASGASASTGTPPAVTLPSGDYLIVEGISIDSAGGVQTITPSSGFSNLQKRDPGVTTSATTATAERTSTGISSITPGTFGISPSQPWVAFTLCFAAAVLSSQTFTTEPLPVPRSPGMEVALWQPRRLGMGKTETELLPY